MRSTEYRLLLLVETAVKYNKQMGMK